MQADESTSQSGVGTKQTQRPCDMGAQVKQLLRDLRSAGAEIERHTKCRIVIFVSDREYGKLLEDSDILALKTVTECVKKRETLIVLFYSLGGHPHVASVLATVLSERAKSWSTFTPLPVRSAASLLCLSGHHLILGAGAGLGPVDPILPGNSDREPRGIAAEDVRLFRRMAREWFGVPGKDAGVLCLNTLATKIFPTTLTAFFRSEQYIETTVSAAVGRHVGSGRRRRYAVQRLMRGDLSHTQCLPLAELKGMGIRVESASPSLDRVGSRVLRICGELFIATRRIKEGIVQGTNGLLLCGNIMGLHQIAGAMGSTSQPAMRGANGWVYHTLE
jgi:hypothetical protein